MAVSGLNPLFSFFAPAEDGGKIRIGIQKVQDLHCGNRILTVLVDCPGHCVVSIGLLEVRSALEDDYRLAAEVGLLLTDARLRSGLVCAEAAGLNLDSGCQGLGQSVLGEEAHLIPLVHSSAQIHVLIAREQVCDFQAVDGIVQNAERITADHVDQQALCNDRAHVHVEGGLLRMCFMQLRQDAFDLIEVSVDDLIIFTLVHRSVVIADLIQERCRDGNTELSCSIILLDRDAVQRAVDAVCVQLEGLESSDDVLTIGLKQIILFQIHQIALVNAGHEAYGNGVEQVDLLAGSQHQVHVLSIGSSVHDLQFYVDADLLFRDLAHLLGNTLDSLRCAGEVHVRNNNLRIVAGSLSLLSCLCCRSSVVRCFRVHDLSLLRRFRCRSRCLFALGAAAREGSDDHHASEQ